MKNYECNKAMNLNASSVDITFTYYDWEQEAVRGWSLVHPDPSHMTQEQCVALLAYRDELEGVKEQIGEANNVDLWRERVANSDRRNVDQFCPFMDFYCDLPEGEYSQSPEAMQSALRLLPVTVVLVGGKPKLAACGEYPNMDMEFCRAYIALGYLPPFVMVNFIYSHPNIEKNLLEACERSIELFEIRCAAKRSILKVMKKNYTKQSFLN